MTNLFVLAWTHGPVLSAAYSVTSQAVDR